MHSKELKVSPKSDYYVYAPSTLAKKLYLYPISAGYFYYEPEYFISRNRFDSFLIMYIAEGNCDVFVADRKCTAKSGQFILLDCYKPHKYGNAGAWEAAWLHFDGRLARDYFTEIASDYGNILSPHNAQELARIMDKLCNLFRTKQPIIESTLSRWITNILNGFLISPSENKKSLTYADTIADSVAYINEHFSEYISLEKMAENANLSPFHFTRIFTKETGFTPHQYLINTRISVAKFMLKSSETPIKDIAFSTGFNSESSFCTTFKKWENLTPSQYREKILL